MSATLLRCNCHTVTYIGHVLKQCPLLSYVLLLHCYIHTVGISLCNSVTVTM